jgi:hypothetical protein
VNHLERTLYYLPRVLSVVMIAFISLFAFDALGSNSPWRMKLAAFAIQLIPSVHLAIALAVAWRWEFAGGSLFIALAAAGLLFFQPTLATYLAVILPVAIIGLLFITHAAFSRLTLRTA